MWDTLSPYKRILRRHILPIDQGLQCTYTVCTCQACSTLHATAMHAAFPGLWCADHHRNSDFGPASFPGWNGEGTYIAVVGGLSSMLELKAAATHCGSGAS